MQSAERRARRRLQQTQFLWANYNTWAHKVPQRMAVMPKHMLHCFGYTLEVRVIFRLLNQGYVWSISIFLATVEVSLFGPGIICPGILLGHKSIHVYRDAAAGNDNQQRAICCKHEMHFRISVSYTAVSLMILGPSYCCPTPKE